jgi:hypothetical protein
VVTASGGGQSNQSKGVARKDSVLRRKTRVVGKHGGAKIEGNFTQHKWLSAKNRGNSSLSLPPA